MQKKPKRIIGHTPDGRPIYEFTRERDDAYYEEQERIRLERLPSGRSRERFNITVPPDVMVIAREIGNGNASRGFEIACVFWQATQNPRRTVKNVLASALAQTEANRRLVTRRDWNRKRPKKKGKRNG